MYITWRGREIQARFITHHIFSDKKHINSYDQNGNKPSYTLHYPEKIIKYINK